MADDRASQLQSLRIDQDDRSGGGGGASIGALAGTALVSLAIGAGGMWFFMQDRTVPDAPARPAQAETPATPPTTTGEPAAAEPARRTVPRSQGLVASGYVVARRQATVSAEITGRIREVLVEEGAVVEEGEVIARLDDERARLDLAQLEARLAAAASRVASLRAQQEEAQFVLDRARQLAERNVGSEAAVTAAQAQVSSFDAQIRSARAEYNAVQVQVRSQQDLIERHVVRAPFAGVVIAKNAQVGEILFPGSAGGGFTRTGVATIVDMDSLEIEVDVNEGQIQRVSPGQRVEAVLDAYPDWRIDAHVEAIIPTADRSRATIQVRVAFDRPDDRILPDMASRVTFIEGRD